MLLTKFIYILILFILWINCPCLAQSDSLNFTPEYFKPKPKLFSVSFKSVRDFNLVADSELTRHEDDEVRQNLRRDIFLRFPVYMKDGLTLGLGLRYRHEKFTFEEKHALDYPLFSNLEDQGLRSTGVDFLFQKKDKQSRSVVGKVGIRFNGDSFKDAPLTDYMRLSLFMFFKRKKNSRTELGYGFSAGYDLGSPMVYPLFSYKHYFNKNFSVDLNLPKQANLIYGFSNKTFLKWTAEISGASYRLEREFLSDFNRLEMRKSEFRTFLTFEQEIYDFLWFGAELGGMQYINFYISEPRKRSSEAIMDLDTSPAYFFKLGIFLVPPKKLYEKL